MIDNENTEGCSFSFSKCAPATEDQTGYEALTYTEIGDVTDMGEYGAELNTIAIPAKSLPQGAEIGDRATAVTSASGQSVRACFELTSIEGELATLREIASPTLDN